MGSLNAVSQSRHDIQAARKQPRKQTTNERARCGMARLRVKVEHQDSQTESCGYIMLRHGPERDSTGLQAHRVYMIEMQCSHKYPNLQPSKQRAYLGFIKFFIPLHDHATLRVSRRDSGTPPILLLHRKRRAQHTQGKTLANGGTTSGSAPCRTSPPDVAKSAFSPQSS